MKLRLLMALGTLSLSLISQTLTSEPELMRVTCYTGGYVTASGSIPREGICAARYDWIGKVAVVYDKDMNFVDCFLIEDTGSHPRITSGRSIDIWKPTLAECYEWVGQYGDYMYVQILDANEIEKELIEND